MRGRQSEPEGNASTVDILCKPLFVGLDCGCLLRGSRLAEPEAGPEAEPEAKPEVEPEAKPKAKAQTATLAEPEAESEAGPDAEPHVKGRQR